MEVLGRSPSFDFKQVLESASFQVLTSLAEEEEDLVKRREKTPQKKEFYAVKGGGLSFLQDAWRREENPSTASNSNETPPNSPHHIHTWRMLVASGASILSSPLPNS
jgi:hypothetical protein